MIIDASSDWVLLTKPVEANIAVRKDGKWIESGKAQLPAGWVAGPGKLK